MIVLMQKQEILLKYLREGKSQREIARETGVDRKTVRNYIYDYEEKLKQLQDATHDIDRGELIQELVEAPRYPVNNWEKRFIPPSCNLLNSDFARFTRLEYGYRTGRFIYPPSFSQVNDCRNNSRLNHFDKSILYCLIANW